MKCNHTSVWVYFFHSLGEFLRKYDIGQLTNTILLNRIVVFLSIQIVKIDFNLSLPIDKIS